MSDEKWEKMEDWEIKTHKRISELENRLNTQSDAIHRNYELIAELREEMKCYMEFWSQQQNQINELKEFGDANKIFLNQESFNKRLLDTNEVLQELIITSNAGEPILHLKDKLERPREIMDDVFETLEGKDSGGEKDGASRDEGRVELKDSDSTNSKPPEPIFCSDGKGNGWYEDGSGNRIQISSPLSTCPKCKHDYYIHNWNGKEWLCPEDRLPGGTGIEPREDSGDDKKYIDPVKQTWYNTKTHIVVKREDLELLLEIIVDEDEKWANIDWKILTKIIWRIKEEYNL